MFDLIAVDDLNAHSDDRPLHRQVTPPETYFTRRNFMRAGVVTASALATGALYRQLNPAGDGGRFANLTTRPSVGTTANGFAVIGEDETSLQDITHYNNFYEFSTDKDGVADAAAGFSTAGWTVAVGGLVGKPRTFDLDDLKKLGPVEERIYRMRCVEGWSMVIPWDGFSLSKLLRSVEPLAGAKFVAFQTLLDPNRMPGQQTQVLEWPYVEGLRMDEAMHPLTMLATGIYGQPLPPQDGAPVRLVAPWKYGFKGIKSIVKMTLLDYQPPTSWSAYAPDEYGFYANVNPDVDHPRWSQATEHRIGEFGRRPTLMFNGYSEQVASLYDGMDLRVNF